jgi:hypothetical protein
MLTPEHFESNEPLPPFSVPVDQLWIDDIEIGATNIPAGFDQNWRIIFQLGNFSQLNNPLSFDTSVAVRPQGSQEKMELIVTRRHYASDGVAIEARPTQEPLVLTVSPSAVSLKA